MTSKEESSEVIPVSQPFGSRFTGEDVYDFDNWYPLLEELTFSTICLPISFAEGQAIKARCSEQHQRNQLLRWGADPAALKPIPIPEVLNGLIERIDGVLASGGGFVRLSNRSPKDAVYDTEYFRQLLKSELQAAFQGPQADENVQTAADMVAFVRASCLANRIESGAQAMELLCSSQRILADLTRTLLVQEESSDQPLQLSCVVRKWYDKIAPEYEFRVFVVDQRVVAITQYYKLAYVPGIAQNADRIRDLIIRYITDQVNPRLTSITTYTADVVFDPENLENIKLIEINNPPPLAGQALFNWNDEADQLILSGRDPSVPCVMRVLTSPPDSKTLIDQIYQPLLPLFNQLRAERNPSHSCIIS